MVVQLWSIYLLAWFCFCLVWTGRRICYFFGRFHHCSLHRQLLSSEASSRTTTAAAARKVGCSSKHCRFWRTRELWSTSAYFCWCWCAGIATTQGCTGNTLFFYKSLAIFSRRNGNTALGRFVEAVRLLSLIMNIIDYVFSILLSTVTCDVGRSWCFFVFMLDFISWIP